MRDPELAHILVVIVPAFLRNNVQYLNLSVKSLKRKRKYNFYSWYNNFKPLRTKFNIS